jgi:hypothetical protein
VGELWQHDSSIHQWWPAADKQTLLLTVDDHSRKLLAAIFVPTDTTWHHFLHLRRAFALHGIPVTFYTDALALFGHESTPDGRDPRSEFQRALTALGVSHLVIPSPQAKGKIERRFGTFQKRIVTLLAYEKITDYAPLRNCWPASWPAKIAPSAAPPVYPQTTPAPRLRKHSAPYCALALTPACWISI